MQCPVDNTTLAMTERAGIEIDYCPTCRGIWLDHGELDKIIERSNTQSTQVSSENNYNDHDYHGDKHDQHKKKKGAFVGDIFGGFGGD